MFVTQLKSFFTVARLGSVTQAARQLGLSQPTVTTQIKALEEHYGVELFRRQGGRLSLSDEGARLLPHVDQLLQMEINVEFALRHSGDSPQGQLRIGATAPYYVLDIVQRYRSRYPLVNISIGAGNSRQMVDALLDYRVDLATSSNPEADPRLHRLVLGADPLVLVLHASHPLADKASLKLADLEACHLIVREAGSTTRQLAEEALARAGVTPASVMEIASREAIRESVIRGMGVSIFARNEAPDHPNIAVLPFDEEVPSLVEYLYCLRERRSVKLIDAFLGLCRPVA
jgi:aminoethylphosphonate catabolism LysR family transcriptional regulator